MVQIRVGKIAEIPVQRAGDNCVADESNALLGHAGRHDDAADAALETLFRMPLVASGYADAKVVVTT